MKYNKLIRDKIPEIIKSKNQNAKVHIATEKEFQEKLKEKLIEEANEFSKQPNKEEFADILEVLYAISDFYKFNPEEIRKVRKEKAKTRGRFKKRLILDETY